MYFCARFLKTDMAQFTEEDKIMRRVEQRFNTVSYTHLTLPTTERV